MTDGERADMEVQQARWRDINWIGVLTLDEYYNGSSTLRAIKPGHTPHLLKGRSRCSAEEGLNIYCETLQQFIDDEIPYEQVWSTIRRRKMAHGVYD